MQGVKVNIPTAVLAQKEGKFRSNPRYGSLYPQEPAEVFQAKYVVHWRPGLRITDPLTEQYALVYQAE